MCLTPDTVKRTLCRINHVRQVEQTTYQTPSPLLSILPSPTWIQRTLMCRWCFSFSSAFNTIIWIVTQNQDNNTFKTITLSTGSQQGCVLTVLHATGSWLCINLQHQSHCQLCRQWDWDVFIISNDEANNRNEGSHLVNRYRNNNHFKSRQLIQAPNSWDCISLRTSPRSMTPHHWPKTLKLSSVSYVNWEAHESHLPLFYWGTTESVLTGLSLCGTEPAQPPARRPHRWPFSFWYGHFYRLPHP